jgi:hypothetical protein
MSPLKSTRVRGNPTTTVAISQYRRIAIAAADAVALI